MHPVWAKWEDASLMTVRLAELGVGLGGPLERELATVLKELRAKGVDFEPSVWISDEWFCPDGVAGFALPFFLTHPRLKRLEMSQMGQVEGGQPERLRRILRHELGHALDNAFFLRRLAERRRIFGPSTENYPTRYRSLPYSSAFVRHLGEGYAQSHPDEDFAETFAVWLDPDSRWWKRYHGTPAIEKLSYMDSVMETLQRKKPTLTKIRPVDPLHTLGKTLGAHYRSRRQRLALGEFAGTDSALLRIFAKNRFAEREMTAPVFLRRMRKSVLREVSQGTRLPQYWLRPLLQRAILRSEQLHLCLANDESKTRKQLVAFLTRQAERERRLGRLHFSV